MPTKGQSSAKGNQDAKLAQLRAARGKLSDALEAVEKRLAVLRASSAAAQRTVLALREPSEKHTGAIAQRYTPYRPVGYRFQIVFGADEMDRDKAGWSNDRGFRDPFSPAAYVRKTESSARKAGTFCQYAVTALPPSRDEQTITAAKDCFPNPMERYEFRSLYWTRAMDRALLLQMEQLLTDRIGRAQNSQSQSESAKVSHEHLTEDDWKAVASRVRAQCLQSQPWSATQAGAQLVAQREAELNDKASSTPQQQWVTYPRYCANSLTSVTPQCCKLRWNATLKRHFTRVAHAAEEDSAISSSNAVRRSPDEELVWTESDNEILMQELTRRNYSISRDFFEAAGVLLPHHGSFGVMKEFQTKWNPFHTQRSTKTEIQLDIARAIIMKSNIKDQTSENVDFQTLFEHADSFARRAITGTSIIDHELLAELSAGRRFAHVATSYNSAIQTKIHTEVCLSTPTLGEEPARYIRLGAVIHNYCLSWRNVPLHPSFFKYSSRHGDLLDEKAIASGAATERAVSTQATQRTDTGEETQSMLTQAAGASSPTMFDMVATLMVQELSEDGGGVDVAFDWVNENLCCGRFTAKQIKYLREWLIFGPRRKKKIRFLADVHRLVDKTALRVVALTQAATQSAAASQQPSQEVSKASPRDPGAPKKKKKKKTETKKKPGRAKQKAVAEAEEAPPVKAKRKEEPAPDASAATNVVDADAVADIESVQEIEAPVEDFSTAFPVGMEQEQPEEKPTSPTALIKTWSGRNSVSPKDLVWCLYEGIFWPGIATDNDWGGVAQPALEGKQYVLFFDGSACHADLDWLSPFDPMDESKAKDPRIQVALRAADAILTGMSSGDGDSDAEPSKLRSKKHSGERAPKRKTSNGKRKR